MSGFNPWTVRKVTPGDEPHFYDDLDSILKPRRFGSRTLDNVYQDLPTKVATVKVSPSVVSLVSYSGDEEIFQCTGTIIQAKKKSAVVLTSAFLLKCPSGGNIVASNIRVVVHVPYVGSFDGDILAFDFHYFLASIKIKPKTRLSPANLACLNDCFGIDPSQISTFFGRRPESLRKHSNTFPLIAGDPVIAIGCYFEKPYEVMAAPGIFCWERSGYECKELYTATCKMTRCGNGGPLVNRFGDVIGICFYNRLSTPFLPINVALTWWEQFKKHGEVRRPSLGMNLSNLYSTSFEFLVEVTRKFPDVSEGIFVEEVTPGSSADAAGMKSDDVIVKFDGKPVRSFLELLKESWNKIGENVDIVVVRNDSDLPVHLSMVVDEVKPDKLYGWENLWRYAG